MNNRRRNRKKAMLNTYVEGRVLNKDPLTKNIIPVEPDRIRFYINLATDTNRNAPFYYSVARGNYILNFDATKRQKRVKLEQMDRYVHETAGTPIRGETRMERALRLIRENSLYGAEGLTYEELLAKKG